MLAIMIRRLLLIAFVAIEVVCVVVVMRDHKAPQLPPLKQVIHKASSVVADPLVSNKLASYTCHPNTDADGRPILTCSSEDHSTYFTCTSAGNALDGSLDYYC
jgi:hypothetical protein